MILLTAPPRTGKSTAIQKIVQMLGPSNCRGFYTEEIRKDGERVGFRYHTFDGKSALLSHVDIDSPYRVSRYGVDIDTFEQICVKELEEALEDDSVSYIIIDEIGPMQLFSNRYKELLMKLVHSNKIVIGTIFQNSYEWLDDFKKEENIQLVEVTESNRDKLPLQIVQLVTMDDAEMQRKVEKARNYSHEEERFETSDGKIIIRSEHGTRTITPIEGGYECDCEYYQKHHTCSHIMAMIDSNIHVKSR